MSVQSETAPAASACRCGYLVAGAKGSALVQCPFCCCWVRAGAQGEDAPIETIHDHHRLISAHKCVCGWEGESAVTHIIDALGLRQIGWWDNDEPDGWPEAWHLEPLGSPGPHDRGVFIAGAEGEGRE